MDSFEWENALTWASTIDDAVLAAIQHVGEKPTATRVALTQQERELAVKSRAEWAPKQRFLRGLFAGGTFCYQSQQILREAGIVVHSNAPLDPRNKLTDPDRSSEHTLLDMGDETYTLGRPHPMIDGSIRRQRILSESRDPSVAVLLLDFILGYNASMDPVGEVLDAILEAQHTMRQQGGELTIVASICGTKEDPQELDLQEKLLREAGVIVFHSNAKAALFCRELLRPA
jgi:FdrA protein